MFSNISLHITLIRVQTPHLAIETDKLEFFFPPFPLHFYNEVRIELDDFVSRIRVCRPDKVQPYSLN